MSEPGRPYFVEGNENYHVECWACRKLVIATGTRFPAGTSTASVRIDHTGQGIPIVDMIMLCSPECKKDARVSEWVAERSKKPDAIKAADIGKIVDEANRKRYMEL